MKSFYNQNKLKAVTFSYDDGTTQDIRLVELLNKYNLKCTFNINSDLLGKNGILTCQNQSVSHYKLCREDIKKVYEGHEVAVHTLTHPNLTALKKEEIIEQVEQDRINLEDIVGYEVVGMAYPCGGINNDDRVAEIIKNYTKIKYCRTITNTDSFDIQDNLYRFNPNVHHLQWERMTELAEKFIDSTPDKPQIFYIWGHSFEMDCDSSYWLKLEDLFKLISNRDDIFYGTNSEVLIK